MYDCTFHQPATITIAGNTGSGKTTLLSRLIRYRNVMFDKPPKYVVLCYSQSQNIYNQLWSEGQIDKLIKGYPSYQSLSELLKPHKKEGSLLIFDDGLQGINEDVTKIFFELSHHANASCCFVTQNLFYDNSNYRDLSLNTMYLFVMKNPRNKTQIMTLARQMSPYKTSGIIESFEKATKEPYCKSVKLYVRIMSVKVWLIFFSVFTL